MQRNKRYTLLLLLLIVITTSLFAQYEPHHPELDWKTLETEHFIFHFHPGTEWSVQMAMKVA